MSALESAAAAMMMMTMNDDERNDRNERVAGDFGRKHESKKERRP